MGAALATSPLFSFIATEGRSVVNEYRKELVSPNGDKYVSTSPRETNDLVYSSGYREVDESASEPAKPAKANKEPSANPFAFGGEVSP